MLRSLKEVKGIKLDKAPSVLVVHGNADKQQIAFTYDCGLEDAETATILDVLYKHRIKCTFFITGLWARKFPELTLRMAGEGHEIGNHSLAHPDMTKISYVEMIQTIKEGEEAIFSVSGIKPELFRHPFGHWNDEVLKAVGEAGYQYSIYWSIDTLDWQLPSVQTIVNRILKHAANGDIVLLHVAGHNTTAATDKAVENLKARGFKFVTISEILE